MNSIALVMIARNESRCIERSLMSVRDWVDEMVVLDTGSTDNTVEKAAACGARVYKFDWVDDFSAARNAALAMTQAPWRFVMDADEWVASGAEVLRDLRGESPNFLGQITISSSFDQGVTGVEQSSSQLSRVLPAGVFYTGRVHEQPITHLRRVRLPLTLGHDGYLPEPMKSKAGRNQYLLRLSLSTRADDPYLQYQMGKDLELQGTFELASEWYQRAYSGSDANVPWRHDLVLRKLYALKRLGHFEQAMHFIETELPYWQNSPDFFFTMGDVFLDWALSDSSQAPNLLPMIEACWQRAMQIGENPDLPDTVIGRGSYLAAHNLAAFHDALGDATQAHEWRDRAAAMRRVGRISEVGA